MYWYGKIDVFKSFITYFTTHEMDKQVSSYVSEKFEEKREKTKLSPTGEIQGKG